MKNVRAAIHDEMATLPGRHLGWSLTFWSLTFLWASLQRYGLTALTRYGLTALTRVIPRSGGSRFWG